MIELSGKRVVVVGLGKSGVAALKLCQRHGATAVGTDSAGADKIAPEATQLGVELALGGHDGARLLEADLIVVSPGVPPLPVFDAAQGQGIPVIGELALGSHFLDAPIVAVGGTNGKSTTTTLLGDLFRVAKKRAFVGGNLGTPVCDAELAEYDVAVLEVSSFQLERAPEFHPRVSILLNISEDHLDRYPSYLAYAEAKGNAFVQQTDADFAIVPDADADCRAQAKRGHGRLVTFGTAGDYRIVGRTIEESASGDVFDLEGSSLHGRHNTENAAAAIAAARALGVTTEATRRGLLDFQPLPHRMTLVATIGGVRFYDDSKGTNVGASVTALRGLSEERGVLIAGGRDKHGSYEPLVRALEDKGRALVLLGEAAPRIAQAVGARVPVAHAASMNEAVTRAQSLAKPGDAVLLSPACSSFDMFKSYADRGEQFTRAAHALAARRGEPS
ncbi:MAG TPA: UDP-N-acetylmuramoyl-L-alanine--D-glutamate ligase [Polyangiaceae bacterium]|jgi:UDP-N-acetylmuramoylalanine--D-glutamate ligase